MPRRRSEKKGDASLLLSFIEGREGNLAIGPSRKIPDRPFRLNAERKSELGKEGSRS